MTQNTNPPPRARVPNGATPKFRDEAGVPESFDSPHAPILGNRMPREEILFAMLLQSPGPLHYTVVMCSKRNRRRTSVLSPQKRDSSTQFMGPLSRGADAPGCFRRSHKPSWVSRKPAWRSMSITRPEVKAGRARKQSPTLRPHAPTRASLNLEARASVALFFHRNVREDGKLIAEFSWTSMGAIAKRQLKAVTLEHRVEHSRTMARRRGQVSSGSKGSSVLSKLGARESGRSLLV